MSYSHQYKVANRGDVWKHYILAAVLEGIISGRSNKSVPFRYFETHAGQGIFSLSSNGEWSYGIGALVNNLDQFGEDNNFYIRTLPTRIEVGTTYFGSWALVARFVADQGISSVIEICDTSNSVADAISNTNPPESILRSVIFHHADGFHMLSEVNSPDLVLIDPPYHPNADADWRRATESLNRLKQRGIPALLWYPVYWPTRPNRLVKDCDCVGFEALWAEMGTKPSQNQKGCGIVAIGAANEHIQRSQDKLRCLAAAFGAGFSLRQMPPTG